MGPLLSLAAAPGPPAQGCLDTEALSDFSSQARMQQSGWVFGWADQGTFKPAGSLEGATPPPGYAYWGFSEAVDGELALPLRGRGLLRLDFGNAWSRPGGRVAVRLNGEAVGAAGPGDRSRLVTLAFEEGDSLKLVESNGMIVVNSIVFDCTPRTTTTKVTSSTTTTAATSSSSSTTNTPTSTTTTSTTTPTSSSLIWTSTTQATATRVATALSGMPSEAAVQPGLSVNPAGESPLTDTAAWPGNQLSAKEMLDLQKARQRASQMWHKAVKTSIQGATNKLEQEVASESNESSALEEATARLVSLQKQQRLELRQAKQERQHAEAAGQRFLQ